MSNDISPRLCIRLSPTMKEQIAECAKSQNISQGRVVRDALIKHFVGFEKIDLQIPNFVKQSHQ
jgi:predicted transcriptional regulator